MRFGSVKNSPRNKYPDDFMEDLEEALLENDKRYEVGIDQFEKVYKRKKLISQTIDEYRHQNLNAKENIVKAKQRLYQIEQLNSRAVKQTVLMRNQIEKINQVHMMSKILMLEKIVRKEKQTEDLLNKRNHYFRVRAQKYKSMLSRNGQKQQRVRHMSMLQSKALKDELEQRKFNNFEQKRVKADQIRDGSRRQRERQRRYEQFKLDRAKKNYDQKAQQLREQLLAKEKEFEEVYMKELQQEKLYQTTQKVTIDYITTLFPTETLQK